MATFCYLFVHGIRRKNLWIKPEGNQQCKVIHSAALASSSASRLHGARSSLNLLVSSRMTEAIPLIAWDCSISVKNSLSSQDGAQFGRRPLRFLRLADQIIGFGASSNCLGSMDGGNLLLVVAELSQNFIGVFAQQRGSGNLGFEVGELDRAAHGPVATAFLMRHLDDRAAGAQ